MIEKDIKIIVLDLSDTSVHVHTINLENERLALINEENIDEEEVYATDESTLCESALERLGYHLSNCSWMLGTETMQITIH